MRRLLLLIPVLFGLSACSGQNLASDVEPIGNAQFGYSIVVGKDMEKGPLSRDGDSEKITADLKQALSAHFQRFDGDRLYHMATIIDGYILARPGIPLVLSQKSALFLKVTIWDDANGIPIHDEPKEFMVLEGFSPQTIIGSGLTQTADQQLAELVANAGFEIEHWLRTQEKEQGWFTPEFTAKIEARKAALDAAAAKLEAN